MKIGVTGGVERWRTVADCGYDYFEANFSSVASCSDAEFRDALRILRETGRKAETFNGFFRGEVRLFEAEKTWLADYVRKGFSRAAELGGEIAVLGSSKARQRPDGMPLSEAKERFAAILRVCGDAAQSVGMRVVVEPLNRDEVNFINTVREGAEICRLAAHPAVGNLVDFFHFHQNGEKLSELEENAELLWHAHLARPNPDRQAPYPEDAPALAAYAEALEGIGYRGRITLECRWSPDPETAMRRAYPLMDVFRRV